MEGRRVEQNKDITRCYTQKRSHHQKVTNSVAVQSSRCGPLKKDNNKLRMTRSKGQMTAFVTGQQDPAIARLGKTVSDPRISFTPATLLTTGSCMRVRIHPIARTLKTLKSMSCTDERQSQTCTRQNIIHKDRIPQRLSSDRKRPPCTKSPVQ